MLPCFDTSHGRSETKGWLYGSRREWARPTVSRTGRPVEVVQEASADGWKLERVFLDEGWPAPTGVVTGRVVAAAESFIVEV